MKKFLYFIFALLTVACGSNQQAENESRNNVNRLLAAEFYATFTKSEFGNDTLAIQNYLKHEAESLDSCYLIHYNQLINGYDIRMKVDSCTAIFNGILCNGKIIIYNGEKAISIVHSICLPDSLFRRLQKSQINNWDYEINKTPYGENMKYQHLGEYRDMPFFFFDVDFDDEEELMMRISGIGQRSRNCYYPIKLNWDVDDWDWEQNITKDIDARFYPFDDMTQFDFANKIFILHMSVSAWGNEWHYYKVENAKSKLVKKIVEDIELGEDKVKRIIYSGDKTTVTEIPLNKDGSYTID